MGFNSSAKKEAKRQQEEALRLEREAYAKAQASRDAYQSTYSTRNAPIIEAQKKSQDFLSRYEKGEDISSLDPTATKYAQQTADQITRTYKTANELGSNAFAKGDSGYQAKLNSVASRNVAKGLAQISEDSLLSNVDRNEQRSMQSTAFLNADQQAGMGLDSNIFQMSSSIFNDTTSKRKLEEDIGMAKMSMLMNGVFGGLSGATAIFCVGEDTVITLEAGFVTANKVRAGEKAKDFNGFSPITDIEKNEQRYMLSISSPHFDILVTPTHHFCRYEGDEDGIPANELREGDSVFTVNGEEKIVKITAQVGIFNVYNFKTNSGVYIADGFYSLS